jgi:hypothetical protein
MSYPVHTLYPQQRDPAAREAARVAMADRETEDAVADLRRLRGVGMGLADVIDRRAGQMMDIDHGKPLPIEAADGFETVALTVRRVIVLQQELLGLREPPQRRAPAAPRQPPVERGAEDDPEDAAQNDDSPAGIDGLLSAFDSLESLFDSLDGGRDDDPAERDDLREPDDLDDDRPIDDVLRDVRKAFAKVANQLLPPDAAKALLDGMNFPAAPDGAALPDGPPSKPSPGHAKPSDALNGHALNGSAADPPGLGPTGGQGPPPG